MSDRPYASRHHRLSEKTYVVAQAHGLLDRLKTEHRIRTDSKLAEALEVPASMISRIRSREIAATPHFILRVHETFGIPVSEIRALFQETPHA